MELAQLNIYFLGWREGGDDLSRLGGGIGTRGPGEQKLETDRRRIREAVAQDPEGDSNRTVATRHRAAGATRCAAGHGCLGRLYKCWQIDSVQCANRFTSAYLGENVRHARSDDSLNPIAFAASRSAIGYGRIYQGLASGLIAAFRATLEEVQEAALIVHVTDVSNRHHAEHDVQVHKVLEDLGVADRARLHVLNKIDRLGEEDLTALIEASRHGSTKILTSAARGAGTAGFVSTD